MNGTLLWILAMGLICGAVSATLSIVVFYFPRWRP